MWIQINIKSEWKYRLCSCYGSSLITSLWLSCEYGLSLRGEKDDKYQLRWCQLHTPPGCVGIPKNRTSWSIWKENYSKCILFTNKIPFYRVQLTVPLCSSTVHMSVKYNSGVDICPCTDRILLIKELPLRIAAYPLWSKWNVVSVLELLCIGPT